MCGSNFYETDVTFVVSCPTRTTNLEMYIPNSGYDDPLVDFIAVYKSGYPNSPIWKTIFSPDGIVLGYFYIEAPQISAKPNLDIELKE